MQSKKKKEGVPVVLVTKHEADLAVARLTALDKLLRRLDNHHPEYFSEYMCEPYDLYFILAIFTRFKEKFESCGKYKEGHQAKIVGQLGFPAPTGSA